MKNSLFGISLFGFALLLSAMGAFASAADSFRTRSPASHGIEGKCGAGVFDTKVGREVAAYDFTMSRTEDAYQFAEIVEGLEIRGTAIDKNDGMIEVSATNPTTRAVVLESGVKKFFHEIGVVEIEHKNYRITVWCR